MHDFHVSKVSGANGVLDIYIDNPKSSKTSSNRQCQIIMGLIFFITIYQANIFGQKHDFQTKYFRQESRSNIYIELGSHTDCRSAASFNLQLSAARSKASAEYIIKKGINRSRITTKGYGESKLLINCGCEGKVKSSCSEDDHAKNRRTEFLITKLK